MEFLFWLTVFLCIYSYALYPAMVYIWAKLVPRRWDTLPIAPKVSMIISVYNEEAVISEKLRNALELDYPEDKLEIIVSSDGSTDRTHELVQGFDDPRIRLIEFPRLGKTACLNKVVPEVQGEIVLFTDANAMFPSDTLHRMVRNFSDSRIGLVTGGTRYLSADGQHDETGLYARLERWTKTHESLVDSCVGADGAIFAIRRELFSPLQGNDINDFIIPLNVVEKGYRVILDPDVNCHEPASDDEKKAFKRQVRITNRTMWALARNMRFANPRRHGAFAVMLISHKILRFGVPFFFLLAGFLNLSLLGSGPIYILSLLAYICFVVVGILGYLDKMENKISGLCKFFLITITAQLFGAIRMMVGIEDKIWTPQR